MSRKNNTELLVIGGEPRVCLLPPEVLLQREQKAIRRRLGVGVLAAVAVVVLAVGGTFALNVQAQALLLVEQSRTADLIVQQAEFAEVTRVQYHLDLTTAAQQVGASTEIDWKDYLQQVQASLPASVAIETVAIDAATPVSLFAQPTAALQGARMATVTFTAKSTVLPDVPAWLRSLAQLPGFADALPSAVTLDETTGVYTASITMHVNDGAFSGRFAPEGAAAETAPDAGTAGTNTDSDTAAGTAAEGE